MNIKPINNSCNQYSRLNFGKNNEKPIKNRTHNSLIKPAVLVMTAFLASGINPKSEIKTDTDNFIRNPELEKRIDMIEKSNKFDWENIPEHEKFLSIFYGSLILLVLINILTQKEGNNNPPHKY